MVSFDPAEHFAEDRLEKLEALEERDVDPYPARIDRTCTVGEYVDRYGDADEATLEAADEEYTLAGRVSRINELGGITFVEITDDTGSVQLFLSRDGTEDYDLLQYLDESDYLRARGVPLLTDRGELSLDVADFSFLVKSLRHPPSYDGLNEQSLIRERGIALRTEALRDRIDDRFAVLAETRAFLAEAGFVEVDTPILQHVYGGASARPFETYSAAVDEQMYLRIATELYLKRLLVGGYDRVYEIGKTFRNEDIDTTHHPEFTMLELYQAYADYTDMMALTEGLVEHLVDTIRNGDRTVEYRGQQIDLGTPWRRLSMTDAIREYGDVDVEALADEELETLAVEHGADFDDGFSRGLAVMELYESLAEGDIVDPTFVVDFPRETSPLSKTKPDDPAVAERFELVVGGVEVANSFTELNDPVEQGEQFARQVEKYRAGDEEAHQLDEDFVETLAFGMPPTGGLGIGMDRLTMVLTGASSIKDVLPFPMTASEK